VSGVKVKPSMKLTKARVRTIVDERETARKQERDAGSAKVVSIAISTLLPDLEIAYLCGDLPPPLSSLIRKCESDAWSGVSNDIHYNSVRFKTCGDEEVRRILFHEAYLPKFAALFPKLLIEKLARYDASSHKSQSRI